MESALDGQGVFCVGPGRAEPALCAGRNSVAGPEEAWWDSPTPHSLTHLYPSETGCGHG